MAEAPKLIAAARLVVGMVTAVKGVSDLIFSPGRAPQVEINGKLVAVRVPEIEMLTPDDTRHLAADIEQG